MHEEITVEQRLENASAAHQEAVHLALAYRQEMDRYREALELIADSDDAAGLIARTALQDASPDA